MWAIIIIPLIVVVILLATGHNTAALIIFGISLIAGVIFIAYMNSDNTENKYKQMQEQRENAKKQEMKFLVKKHFNIDFWPDAYLNSDFAVDTSRKLIFLKYCENTIWYMACIEVGDILNYSFEYIDDTPSVVIYPAYYDYQPTGRYILSIKFCDYGGVHISNTEFPDKETGQLIIKYLDLVV